jgi:hypothetical protein
MMYYVGQNAEATAEALWATKSNTQGNTGLPATDDGAKTTAN